MTLPMIPEPILLIYEGMLLLAMGFCLGRVAKGPRAADRMVAVDQLALIVAMFLIAHAVRVGERAFLDIVLVFSVVAFFGTVGLARYLQLNADDDSNEQDKP